MQEDYKNCAPPVDTKFEATLGSPTALQFVQNSVCMGVPFMGGGSRHGQDTLRLDGNAVMHD